MIQLAIHEAINGRDLDYTIARATMEEMMDGTATDIEMATLLTALRMKGETITEITACAEVMRERARTLSRRARSWTLSVPAVSRLQSTAIGRFRPSRAQTRFW